MNLVLVLGNQAGDSVAGNKAGLVQHASYGHATLTMSTFVHSALLEQTIVLLILEPLLSMLDTRFKHHPQPATKDHSG